MAEGGGPEPCNAAEPVAEPASAQSTLPSIDSQKQTIGTLLKTTLRKGDECLREQLAVSSVVEHGMFVKHCKVEVYLLELNLCENDNMDNVVTRHFSKADTIDTIEKEMRTLFNIPSEKETRLWNKYMSNTYEQLNKPESTVQDAGLFQGQVLVIERKNEDGTWPRQAHAKSSTTTSRTFTTSPKLSSNSSATISSTVTNGDNSSNSSYMLNNSTSGGIRLGGYSSYSSSYNYRESASQPGLCGLSNLGNTCFMNSALQCLSNLPPLTEYFLEDQYEAEINRENPLGMRGEIAEAFADLIKQMWLSRSSYVAPRTFKTQVGRFAPQFSGYQQQDSQELLAFLLDGLHEDLNRVKKKPYLALRDAEGRPDEIVAKEAWKNHRLRNDSIIVDIFHGLFKSTLVCPECSKVSVTFDPFCYLTLPLPMKKDRTMEVFLVRNDPQSRPMQFRVVVPKLGTVADLCSALSKLSGIPADNKDDIFIYEVLEEDSERMNLPVYFRERDVKHSGGSSCTMLFGQPFFITVPRHNPSLDTLYERVLERIGRYVKQPQGTIMESRAVATATSSSSHSDNGELLSSHNAVLSDCSSPMSNGASGSVCSTTGSNHSDTCNGPNRVCDVEEEAMDHQLSPDPESSQSETVDGENETSESENGAVSTTGKTSRSKLFSFSMVNSYGTANISPLAGNILKLTSHSTIAIDWDTENKRLCYNGQEAEAYDKHESMMQAQKKKATVALRECIELFTTMEILGEHDPWYCPTCKKHQQATKKFDLWSLPNILVVHLKRFSYNRCWRDKLDTVVDFPIRDLNMSEFVCNPKAEPYIYDLVAVSNHYGGMGGGHYTAYAKNKSDGKWYYFDDSSVSSASEDQIVTKAAYVLFYQRRDGEGASTVTSSASLGGASDSLDDHMDTN
ncbi:Ubiquitin carboxyl-terminal hydrolase 4 [Bagarius yarrelli]|uniref:Ubiquitin carboxyl-terminal hydrolase n=1 Tax=Bagarius yarrelli TaxID=175774 RepID=A0A556VY03_BAGYA|nr:Ubiquitin carboxyl-terminal hydrolase 4 [Bagarius yarrelli]